MPTPKAAPKPVHLEYIQNTLMQDQDGDIRNRVTMKSALKPTPSRTFLVYCGNSRYFPAQDVAWYLQRGEWPKVDTWIKLVDNGKPWTPAHLLPGNLYAYSPGNLLSYVEELERVHMKMPDLSPLEAATKETIDDTVYRHTMAEAEANFKNGYRHLLTSMRPQYLGTTLNAQERRDVREITVGINTAAGVQGWGFDPLAYLAFPDEDATVTEYADWAKRAARAISPDMRGVDEATFAALCGKSASNLFD